MGVIIRQSIKSVIISYLGIAIAFVNMLFIFPLFLSPEEIGLVNVLKGALVSIFAAIAQMGAITTVVKYFPYFNKKEEGYGGILFTGLSIAAVGFAICTAFFLLFNQKIVNWFIDKSPLLVDYIYYAIPIAACFLLFNVLESFTRSLKRIVIPNLFRDLVLRIGFGIAALLYGLHFISLDGMVLSYVINFGLIALLMLLYLASMGQLYIKPRSTVFKSDLFPEMMKFSLFTALISGAAILQNQIDMIMLASWESLAASGIYSVAFYICAVIEMPRRALGQITIPVIADAWKDENYQKIDELYTRTALVQLAAGCLIFLLIWINTDSLFDLMPNGDKYRPGKYVILFIGLAKVFDMMMGINTEIIVTSPYYKWNLPLILLLILLTFTSNWILIPIYGLTGAAIATAISVFLFNAIRFLFIFWKFRFQPFQARTPLLILLAIAVYFTLQLVPDLSQPIPNIILQSMLCAILFVLPMLSLKLVPDANAVLSSLVAKLKK